MRHFSFLILSFFTLPGYAENFQDSTKQQYHLFNPTPVNQMRGFETDRPDLTESAYTVDAGHFQFETDLFSSTRQTTDGITSVQNSFNVFNLKIGITNSLDLQLISGMLVKSKIKGGNSESQSSFSNITIRAKLNIYGNDSGKSAMALLPSIIFPTTPEAKITGGVVLPFSLSLPNGWGFGAQIGTDLINNETGDGYHINPLISATFSHQLFQNFNLFMESLISRESELKNNEIFLNTGFSYELVRNTKLDAGIFYGLKDVTPKIYFFGFSFRI